MAQKPCKTKDAKKAKESASERDSLQRIGIVLLAGIPSGTLAGFYLSSTWQVLICLVFGVALAVEVAIAVKPHLSRLRKKRWIMTGEDRDALGRLGKISLVCIVSALFIHYFLSPAWQWRVVIVVGISVFFWLVCNAAEDSTSKSATHHFFGVCKRLIEGFWRIVGVGGGGIYLFILTIGWLLHSCAGEQWVR